MSHPCITFAFLLASLAVFAPAAAAADAPNPLDGTWQLVSGEKAGRTAPEADAKSLTLVIAGDTITFVRGDHREKMKLTLDPAASPKRLTLTAPDGKTRPGIYDRDGDTLKLCLSGTAEPPTDFATTNESRTALMTLHLKKD
jgi:uncharacterized protein (TIGR03067 family)